jgi:hypothetical protein
MAASGAGRGDEELSIKVIVAMCVGIWPKSMSQSSVRNAIDHGVCWSLAQGKYQCCVCGKCIAVRSNRKEVYNLARVSDHRGKDVHCGSGEVWSGVCLLERSAPVAEHIMNLIKL